MMREEVWAEEGGVRLSVETAPGGMARFTIATRAGDVSATVAAYRVDRIVQALRPAAEGKLSRLLETVARLGKLVGR